VPPVNRKEERGTPLEDIPKELGVILGRDMVKTVSVADVVTSHPTIQMGNDRSKSLINNE